MISERFMEHLKQEVKKELLNEGYIHKSQCPSAREGKKLRELKKANKSLQRRNQELTLQLEAIKLMR